MTDFLLVAALSPLVAQQPRISTFLKKKNDFFLHHERKYHIKVPQGIDA